MRWYRLKLKEFNIKLDIKKQVKTPYIEIVQNDNLTNVLNITLLNCDKEYQINDGEIEIAFLRADNTVIILDNVDVSSNEIRCILDKNTISVAGKMLGEVRIKNNDTLLTTSQFDFYVRQVIK